MYQGYRRPSQKGSPHLQRLSHELRTPLNAILGNTELLLDGTAGPLAEEARRCIADIQTAGRALLDQSRTLLLLIQALDESPPGRDDVIPLRPLFDETWRDGRPGARVELDTTAGGDALAGNAFWLRTLALLVAEAAGPDRSVLRVGVGDGPVLTLSWQDLEVADLPPTVIALFDAILRLHGGALIGAEGPRLLLGFPADRIGRGRG